MHFFIGLRLVGRLLFCAENKVAICVGLWYDKTVMTILTEVLL